MVVVEVEVGPTDEDELAEVEPEVETDALTEPLELAWLDVEPTEVTALLVDEVVKEDVVDVEDLTKARYPPAAAMIRIITITTTATILEIAVNWPFLILYCGVKSYLTIYRFQTRLNDMSFSSGRDVILIVVIALKKPHSSHILRARGHSTFCEISGHKLTWVNRFPGDLQGQ